MRLNEQGLTNEREKWELAGYKLPQYDRATMISKTKENPQWLHFGAGNIFRAFQANVVEDLLNEGVLDHGLIAVGGYEAMEKLFHPHDNYMILATLKADGTVDKTVIGSVVETLTIDMGYRPDYERLIEIFKNPSLQMVSFTITEKGYSLVGVDGEFTGQVKADFGAGPERSFSYMGKIAAFLYQRFLNGELPIAMVSMDNCSHNGDKLRDAIVSYAEKWEEKGLVKEGFLEYLKNPKKVSFPWSMIDKITPRPDATVEAMLEKDEIEDLRPIITKRKTYIAPFVNAEESQYLVIEDSFPNGRPEWEKGGIIFTDRETVEKVETMKVCTCLNPLHTTLSVFGCLLNIKYISDEMKDTEIRKLVEGVAYKEGLPVVVNPGVLDPKEFISQVMNVRLPNPFMMDRPQRIAVDTSQKLAIRFGETIKKYEASEELNVSDLKLIPLVFAGWLRYLMALDDNGEMFELSPDPMLDTLCPIIWNIKLGMTEDVEPILKPILEDETIFGVNLYKVGMAEKVCDYFKQLIAGPGAVRATLKAVLD